MDRQQDRLNELKAIFASRPLDQWNRIVTANTLTAEDMADLSRKLESEVLQIARLAGYLGTLALGQNDSIAQEEATKRYKAINKAMGYRNR